METQGLFSLELKLDEMQKRLKRKDELLQTQQLQISTLQLQMSYQVLRPVIREIRELNRKNLVPILDLATRIVFDLREIALRLRLELRFAVDGRVQDYQHGAKSEQLLAPNTPRCGLQLDALTLEEIGLHYRVYDLLSEPPKQPVEQLSADFSLFSIDDDFSIFDRSHLRQCEPVARSPRQKTVSEPQPQQKPLNEPQPQQKAASEPQPL